MLDEHCPHCGVENEEVTALQSMNNLMGSRVSLVACPNPDCRDGGMVVRVPKGKGPGEMALNTAVAAHVLELLGRATDDLMQEQRQRREERQQ